MTEGTRFTPYDGCGDDIRMVADVIRWAGFAPESLCIPAAQRLLDALDPQGD